MDGVTSVAGGRPVFSRTHGYVWRTVRRQTEGRPWGAADLGSKSTGFIN